MKILGTGLNGLVGSRIVELLPDYSFENVSLITGVDITNADQVKDVIEKSDAEVVLHLAALADVDGCEKDREQAKRVNVGGTENIVAACKSSGKKIIYISTDFVFSGEDQPEGGYTEADTPHPVNYYGQTKYEGEKVIQGSGLDWVIARIAYPYRAIFDEKKDFVRGILSRLQGGETLTMVTDHLMTPTFIDDIAHALHVLIEQNPQGIFHVVGSSFVTPFQAATAIADVFDIPNSKIEKTTRQEFFKDRAPRPFQGGLNNDKIVKLGVSMKGFEDGLLEIKKQTSS